MCLQFDVWLQTVFPKRIYMGYLALHFVLIFVSAFLLMLSVIWKECGFTS